MDFNDFKELSEKFELMQKSLSSKPHEESNSKQDNISIKKNNNGNLYNNGKFEDIYADFTEFEDENGNIMLIKYSEVEYEFRGNKYCKYILCNEKTGSREDGIAQIKNGQKVHLKDEERILKIKEYIKHQKIENEKTIYPITGKLLIARTHNVDSDWLELIGYKYDEFDIFQEKFTFLYRAKYISHDPYFIISMPHGGSSQENYNTAMNIMKRSNFIIVNKIENSEDNKTIKQNQAPTLPQTKKEKVINTLLLLPMCLVILYPISEFIMWILSYIAPIIWNDTISAVKITDFAIKYLPYAYHPDCNWFMYLSVNFCVAVIFTAFSIEFHSSKSKFIAVSGNILALGFLFIMFSQKAFNILAMISAAVVGLSLLYAVYKKYR